MREHFGDESLDDSRFAFGLDLQRIVPNVSHEAVDAVAQCEPAHRFTEENALDHAPNFHASPLAHLNASSSFCYGARESTGPAAAQEVVLPPKMAATPHAEVNIRRLSWPTLSTKA